MHTGTTLRVALAVVKICLINFAVAIVGKNGILIVPLKHPYFFDNFLELFWWELIFLGGVERGFL